MRRVGLRRKSRPNCGLKVKIPAGELRGWATCVLVAAGVREDHAALVAESLVKASLRGVDSHGVQLLVNYLDQLHFGDMDAGAVGEVISETGGLLVYDGHNGIGQVVASICGNHAVRLARMHGIGFVVARESNHFGAAAYWAERISSHDLMGVVFCNASPIVPPWQAKEPRFGTNPICMSVPKGERNPWLLDMATTTVAAGKIFKARMNGVPNVPAGWAMDKDGVPTTDTEAAYQGLLMPLGGYKGSGLAFMVEILTGVIGGGAMSTELGGIRFRGKKVRASQAFLAIDVLKMQPDFRERLDWLIGHVKEAAPAVGFDEVLVANEPELRTERARLAEGVTVPDGTWEQLLGNARRVGVGPPT